MMADTVKVNWDQVFCRSRKDNKRIKETEHKYEKSSFSVRKCPKCGKAWENLKTFDSKRKSPHIYIDEFPTYGLELKTCPPHREESNH